MPVWSHTRIESFRQCPRKYFYRYVKRVKLPEEPETLAQFLGKRVHESLEWLYGEAQRRTPPAEAALLADFARRWDAEWHDGVALPDETTPAEHRAVAQRWLADYHRRHAPFASPRTMAIERRISFPLDGPHSMQGFVDRIARTDDGTWQIHDYKTNRKLPTQQEKDDDPQLAYYQIGLRTLWPEAEKVELVWHFLAFDTAITSRRTPEALEQVRADALATIADIEPRGRAEDAYPTHESVLCAYCEFEAICPARRHAIGVRKLSPEQFLRENGVQLVNRWSELDAAKRELKSRMDALEREVGEIQAKIAAYADQFGLEVVSGADREATVRHSEKVVFPRRSYPDEAEEAAALEQQLRASPRWGDVSEVNRFALERLWARRATLDADLRALLEEFGRLEQVTDVRLRRARD